MYLVAVKTVITKAMQRAFDDNAPEPDFANLHVSIEYPIDSHNYPSIWVDFDPTGDLRIAGIGHTEGLIESDPLSSNMYRWRFQGTATFTVVAFTSLERDRLYDAVIKVLAFGDSKDNLGRFRSYLESNSLIAMNANFDKISQSGFSTAQGTPWGTDEMMYEATLSMEIIGEFVVSNDASLIPLSEVNLTDWVDVIETDPTSGGGWIG